MLFGLKNYLSMRKSEPYLTQRLRFELIQINIRKSDSHIAFSKKSKIYNLNICNNYSSLKFPPKFRSCTL